VSPKSGTALGPMPVEQFDSSLKPMKVPLGRGDRVVLYSDGLVETMNPKEVMYEARLQEFVKNAGSVPSSEFLSGLLKDLESFRQGCEPPDDLTIVTFLVVP
jgi:serine phosphatase RsbU (regulator of sigma subunit)